MKVRETKTPGIPDIRDDNVLAVLRAIKSTLEVREGHSGDQLDQNVTYRNLTELGLADPDSTHTTDDGGTLPVGPPGGGFPGGPGSGYNPSGDLSIPPQPTGLKVYGGFTALYLEWDGAPYRNHAYTEIWRNSRDDLGTAIFVGTSASSVYADPAEPDSTYWYWIRFVSMAGVTGPWNLTSGTSGHTAMDVGKAIEALSKEFTNSPLWTALSQRISQIETDEYIANRSLNSSLEELTARVDANVGRLIELHTVTQNQATLLVELKASGSGGANRVFFTPERPDAATPGLVAGAPLNAGDVWYDTDDGNRSSRWSGADWILFVSSGIKVYHQPTDPASFNGTDWVDATGRNMIDGDLWYDSDDGDRPWRWIGSTHAWIDTSTSDNSAGIITLEQTKIGYATLDVASPHGPAGAVFDNGGAIWNNVATGDPDYAHSAQFYNSSHANTPGVDSKVTWHIGLPFAQATKQVGVSADGGTTNVTIQQQFTTMQTTDTHLLAQYTVKIDINGYVTGFGLSATNPDQPTSMFLVSADRFAIGPAFPNAVWSAAQIYAKNDVVKMDGGNPVATHVFQSRQANNKGHQPVYGAIKAEADPWWSDLTARLPFITTTIATVIDGKTYPPGVWMNTANIADATIQSAQIGSLVADKIVTGTLTAAISINTGKIYGGVNIGQPIGSASYGNGFFLGDDGGVQKFYVGQANNSYILWDGVTFEVRGRILGTSGFIGGINMQWDSVGKHGQLFSNNVTSFTAGTGFWLDDTARFRIGNPQGSRLEWDGSGIAIYDKNNAPILVSGNSIAWSGISGPPPASIANATITINANGTLTGAGGGGPVTAAGIGAIRTDASNAPASVLNQNVHVSSSGPGQITLTGAGAGTISGVVMPGWKIDANNVGTYMASAAITQAYIGLLAVGAAQIVNATITGAKIANLAVDTLQIAGEAVVIPRFAKFGTDQIVNYTTTTLFGGDTTILEFSLTGATTLAIVTFTCEVDQPGGNGGRFRLTCYLGSGGAGEKSATFDFGIIDNQPRFSQTAVFGFENLVVGAHWLRVEVRQITGDNVTNYFGNQYATLITAKK